MNNIAKYLAVQVANDKLKYEDVIKMYPQYKQDIDTHLKEYFANTSIIPTIISDDE